MSHGFDQSFLIRHQAREMLRGSKTGLTELPKSGAEKESDLQSEIAAECRRRGWLVISSGMHRATSNQPGTPDFIIVTDLNVLFVECKTRTGKLSYEQQCFKAHLEKLGGTYHLVRSFTEFMAIFLK